MKCIKLYFLNVSLFSSVMNISFLITPLIKILTTLTTKFDGLYTGILEEIEKSTGAGE